MRRSAPPCLRLGGGRGPYLAAAVTGRGGGAGLKGRERGNHLFLLQNGEQMLCGAAQIQAVFIAGVFAAGVFIFLFILFFLHAEHGHSWSAFTIAERFGRCDVTVMSLPL